MLGIHFFDLNNKRLSLSSYMFFINLCLFHGSFKWRYEYVITIMTDSDHIKRLTEICAPKMQARAKQRRAILEFCILLLLLLLELLMMLKWTTEWWRRGLAPSFISNPNEIDLIVTKWREKFHFPFSDWVSWYSIPTNFLSSLLFSFCNK